MTNSQRLATVRKRFLDWLESTVEISASADSEDSLIIRESMLIRDEFFCGRTFHAEHYNAVWFIEEDVLKIHRADGSLELVLQGVEIDQREAKAAEVVPHDVGELAVSRSEQQPAIILLEDAVAEDAVAEDAVAEDAVAEDAVAEDAVAEDASEPRSETHEDGPTILKLPSATERAGEAEQHTVPHQSTVAQTSGEQSGDAEVRKAA
ncbi:hypothetical protein N9F62_01125 [bacterium]|nr:hypothetical protein [bacterium]